MSEGMPRLSGSLIKVSTSILSGKLWASDALCCDAAAAFSPAGLDCIRLKHRYQMSLAFVSETGIKWLLLWAGRKIKSIAIGPTGGEPLHWLKPLTCTCYEQKANKLEICQQLAVVIIAPLPRHVLKGAAGQWTLDNEQFTRTKATHQLKYFRK